MLERFEALRRFVQENLRVFVDVAELASAQDGRSLAVRWTWRRTFDEGGERQSSSLDVELTSESELLLEPRQL